MITLKYKFPESLFHQAWLDNRSDSWISFLAEHKISKMPYYTDDLGFTDIQFDTEDSKVRFIMRYL